MDGKKYFVFCVYFFLDCAALRCAALRCAAIMVGYYH